MMPLIAHDEATGERLDITEIDDPRRTLAGRPLVCQLCETTMVVKHGQVVRPHFAHLATCASRYAQHAETRSHLLGKDFLSRYLRQHPTFQDAQIALEVPMASRQRIADVMVTCLDGQVLVIELQVSRTTAREIEARSRDYLAAGMAIVWVFGKRAATHSVTAWCDEKLHGYLLLDLSPGAPTWEGRHLVAMLHAASLPPQGTWLRTLLPCLTCGSTQLWQNASYAPICQRCHPPASQAPQTTGLCPHSAGYAPDGRCMLCGKPRQSTGVQGV